MKCLSSEYSSAARDLQFSLRYFDCMLRIPLRMTTLALLTFLLPGAAHFEEMRGGNLFAAISLFRLR